MQIQSIVSDNASNNDTMMDELELLLANMDIIFDAVHAHSCCLPHIVHLAALKVCIKPYIYYFLPPDPSMVNTASGWYWWSHCLRPEGW